MLDDKMFADWLNPITIKYAFSLHLQVGWLEVD